MGDILKWEAWEALESVLRQSEGRQPAKGSDAVNLEMNGLYFMYATFEFFHLPKGIQILINIYDLTNHKFWQPSFIYKHIWI